MKNSFLIILFLALSYLPSFSQLDTTSYPNEYIDMPFNISLYPGGSIVNLVGVNKKIINHVVFNIIGGEAAVLRGVEFGSVINIYTEDVTGAQFAGVVNIIGNDVKAAQFAGVANITGGSALAAQFAGIINMVEEDFKGAQYAGITNINGGDEIGAQWAGIANLNAGNAYGAQFAGIANINGNSFSGAQFAGVTNIQKTLDKGAQFAGIVNISDTVKSGVQIAPVNLSEVNNGIPIGLFSYVKNAGLNYSLWADETSFINAGLMSGNEKFKNMLFLGLKPDESMKYTLGFTFGVHFNLTDKFYLDPQISTQVIKDEKDAFFEDISGNLSRLKLLAGYQIADFVSVFAGPTFNFYYSDDRDGSDIYSGGSTGKTGDIFYRTWFGFSAGLRF